MRFWKAHAVLRGFIKCMKVIFFLIGFFYVLVEIGSWSIGHFVEAKEDISERKYMSPDGSYIANVLTRVVEGGAVASGCSSSVIVYKKNIHVLDKADYDRYQVYLSDCDYFIDAPSPTITWVGNDFVEINFATQLAYADMKDVFIRSLDASGKVKIKFVSE